MFINNRVIYKDNATKTDISALLSDPHSAGQTFALVAAEDALYIGSDLPFNHRFFMVGETKNEVAGAVAVAIWNGTEFVACEDVQDLTAASGAPFAKSGIIRFALPANTGWSRVYDSSEISELSTLKSKANYWAKLTFSAAFAFDLSYVGFAFARDADLKTYYRDLLSERMMNSFNGGQPMLNWDAVHVVAAEEIIRDLRSEEIVFSPNQVLDPETFTDAACHKLAEMAWSQLSNDERLEFAQGKYRQAMAKKVFNVDKDCDGRLDTEDKQAGWRLSRV